MSDTPTRAESLEKLADLIKDIRFAMLVTHDTTIGSLRGRPMATVNKDVADGKIYFFTSKDEPKVMEAMRDPGVCLAYADPGSNNYVSVSGSATLSTDRALLEKFYNPFVKAWFPEGLDDPTISLLIIDIEHAEYWDSPSSTLIQLYGLAKVMLTGTPPDGGENEKVTL